MPATARSRLLAEVGVLEAEVALYAELVDTGHALPGRRLPFPHEVRAGVMFAELDRLVEDATGRLSAIGVRVRGEVLDRLALDLGADLDDPAAIPRRLAALADPTDDAVLAGLREEVLIPARLEAYTILDDLHRAAGEQALAEASRQGAPVAGRLAPRPDRRVADLLTERANAVGLEPYRRLVDVARTAALNAPPGVDAFTLLDTAIEAAEQASPAGAEDLARQAATVAHDEGRTATLRELAAPATAGPGGIDLTGGLQAREVYASELLDGNTCQPCSLVDGRTYGSVEEALLDYPGNGGYVLCSGGPRCRGSLVIVWATEAEPTVDDRRGDDPSAPPPGGPPPPPPPPARPVITSATDLATIDTADLAGALEQAYAAGDYQAAEALSDELDRRDPLPEPPASAEEVASAAEWQAEAQAVEDYLAGAIGRTAARGARPARGRAIDRVRADYDEWTYGEWLAAENATRGNLVRKGLEAEFRTRYGDEAALFTGPARVAGHYASDELLEFWRTRQRLTFYEFAEQAGITDAKTRARARTAREARDSALFRNAGRSTEEVKRRAPRSTPRRPLTAGEQLARDQRRAARSRRLAGE